MKRFPGDLLEHARGLTVLAAELALPGAGAFERAAERLRVDPSVLRRRVQALGAWVGQPLLEGRGARLRLSPAGARAVSACERLLAAAEALAVAPPPRRLAIGCTGTIITELLPAVLLALEQEAPGTRVAARRLGSAACVKLLAADELDLGVVRGVAPPPGFSAEHLCDDRLWLAAPAAHPLLRRPLTLESIAREPLILYGESSQTRARVLGPLAPLGAEVRVEVDGKASALEYVARGLGVSFLSLLPAHAVKRPGVVLREVTSLFPRASFWVLRARDASPLAVRVGRLMRTLVKRGSPGRPPPAGR